MLRRLRLLRKIVDTHYYIKKQLAEKTQELPLLGRKKTKNFSPQPLSLGLGSPPEALSVAVQRGPLCTSALAKTAHFSHKMAENTLKVTSKTAQNGVKTRFSASPTFKTHFWTKSLEVDFFTQMTPFSTPTAEAGPGAEKRPSGGQKSAFSPLKWCFQGSEVGF